MLENRPIMTIAIGYIIGIIMGLYCKISMVLLYLIIFPIIYLMQKMPKTKKFKLISFRRYFRYIKIIITKKVVILILISSIFSNIIIIYKNNQYNNIQNYYDGKEIQVEGIVISNLDEKTYSDLYKIKIKKIISNISDNLNNSNNSNNSNNLKEKLLNNKIIYLKVSKSKSKSKNTNGSRLEYGDKIMATGIFKKPQVRTNYGGFDYNEYLRSKDIYGILESKNIEKRKNKENKEKFKLDYLLLISKYFNNQFLKIKDLIQEKFESDVANIILGMALGYTDEIDEEIKSDFSNSNISHILAVSGMHVGYLILFCKISFEKTFGKRISNILNIIILIYYTLLIGGSSSIIRACIMAIISIISKLIYRKSDVWTNISISLLVLLFINPYSILSTGLILSYSCTIGIIIFIKTFKSKKYELSKINFKAILKFIRYKILELIKLTAFVNIFIIPITAIYFNKISVLSLMFSGLVGILVAPIIILFFLLVLKKYLGAILIPILNIIAKVLIIFADLGAKIPFGKILVVTPNILEILIYYFILFLLLFIFKYKNQKTAFGKRVKNLINLFKFRLNQNKNKVISTILICIIIFLIIKIIPNNLRIYFLDVGQGDSCLIVTPKNKTILIDGGGSETYDIGKNTLLPYLLDRRIRSLDYAIISHFDTDHIGGILYLMENIEIKNIVISKQFEDTENLKEFNNILKNKKTNLKIVQAGNKLGIENNMYFNILYPENENLIIENKVNNNSIVCKLNYMNFSMLFTGDIEEVAEKKIVEKYKNTDVLNSNILKVAHHGSNSSSIQEFLDLVNPQIAIIGVGENNKYGHPNEEVIERLYNFRY